MATRNLRTADYPEEARRALGEAIAAARRAAGFRWRTEFVRAHDGVGITSLNMVESFKPLVGVAVLQAIGRALGEHFPGRWTADTPRLILEGTAPPALDPPSSAAVNRSGASAVITSSPDDPEFWVALRDEVPAETFDRLWRLYVDKKRLQAERDYPEGNPPHG